MAVFCSCLGKWQNVTFTTIRGWSSVFLVSDLPACMGACFYLASFMSLIIPASFHIFDYLPAEFSFYPFRCSASHRSPLNYLPDGFPSAHIYVPLPIHLYSTICLSSFLQPIYMFRFPYISIRLSACLVSFSPYICSASHTSLFDYLPV